ncbi:hypothetical protein OGATHE_006486 [Ogataea polymorpha]|uniref:ZZ-type domain-containing protein n=1 Tax=Ogataea polymorpha TaxID=460523 RepID=A0A9P8SYD0_9ASCO|nr:hypothetical protein OGATHE_006486 [Ogataea polymorpha]
MGYDMNNGHFSGINIAVKATIIGDGITRKLVFTTDRNKLLSKEQILREIYSHATAPQLKSTLASSSTENIQLQRKSKKSGRYVELASVDDFSSLKRSLTVKSHLKLNVFIKSASEEEKEGIDYTAEVQKILKRIEDLFSSHDNTNLRNLSNSISNNLSNLDILKFLGSLVDTNLSRIILKMNETSKSSEFKSTYRKVFCDGCDAHITDTRYKCTQCADFDLCLNCKAKKVEINDHTIQHQLLRIDLASESSSNPIDQTLSGMDMNTMSPLLSVESAHVYDNNVSNDLLNLGANNGEKLKELAFKCAQFDSLLEMVDAPEDEKVPLLVQLIEDHNMMRNYNAGAKGIEVSCTKQNSRILQLALTNRLARDILKPDLKTVIGEVTKTFMITPNVFKNGSTRYLMLDTADWGDLFSSTGSTINGTLGFTLEVWEDQTLAAKGSLDFNSSNALSLLVDVSEPKSAPRKHLEETCSNLKESEPEFVMVDGDLSDTCHSADDNSLMDEYDILSSADCED